MASVVASPSLHSCSSMVRATALLGPSKEVTVISAEAAEKSDESMDRLGQLVPAQREVAQKIIGTPGGSIVLSAGPGVGKTFTMTRTVDELLSTGTFKAIVIAPTNVALRQWSALDGRKDVYLTTAASLVGRGILSPRLPPSTATFELQCSRLQHFLTGDAFNPRLDGVLVIWDEVWNTPAQDINNGQDILSKVTQVYSVTMVFMGDPFQLKPVDGDSPLLSGPFHELSRTNLSTLPRLSRRKLLENLITIPGASQRTQNAPDEVRELVDMAVEIERLLRLGDLVAADARLVELQRVTARMVPRAGPGAVFLTATREQQLRRQREAMGSHPDPEQTLLTGTKVDRPENRTCIVVGAEHMLLRYVTEARVGGRKSAPIKAFSNGTLGVVTSLDHEPKVGRFKKRRRMLSSEPGTTNPHHVWFQPRGSTESYRIPATAVTTTTAMTIHRAQGSTMPAGVRVVLDLHRCTAVYREDRQDMVAALVVGLSRAQDAPTVVVNYEPGTLLRYQAASGELPVSAAVTRAFLGMVQRLTAGGVVRVVPRKVRLKVVDRHSLQRQLDEAYSHAPQVKIVRWDPATAVATLASGLEVQAIGAGI